MRLLSSLSTLTLPLAPFIVRVISLDTGHAITYLLKAGIELNERNDRKLVSQVAYARHLREGYRAAFADFPVHFELGHYQYRKECDETE